MSIYHLRLTVTAGLLRRTHHQHAKCDNVPYTQLGKPCCSLIEELPVGDADSRKIKGNDCAPGGLPNSKIGHHLLPDTSSLRRVRARSDL